MATNYKVLGQINPSANTMTIAYTVPSATETVISTITVCNQTGSNVSYSIAVVPNGVTLDDKHFIVRGGAVPAADSIGITLGITLDADDEIRCNTNSGSVSFNVFGSEVT